MISCWLFPPRSAEQVKCLSCWWQLVQGNSAPTLSVLFAARLGFWSVLWVFLSQEFKLHLRAAGWGKKKSCCVHGLSEISKPRKSDFSAKPELQRRGVKLQGRKTPSRDVLVLKGSFTLSYRGIVTFPLTADVWKRASYINRVLFML